MTTELAGTIALCLCTRKPPAIAEVSAGTGRIVLRLLAPPSVKATLSRRQGAKASFERSRLAAPRAVAPRIAIWRQEGPTKFVALSPARLPSKKKFSEFCGNARVAAARSAPEIVRDLIPPAQNSRPNLASGLFVFNFEILRANARCGTRSQSAQRFKPPSPL